jgi:predicted phosphodiesterase
MSPEKLILISDIHSNLPALEAVLADISRRGLSSAPVCFLGDAVNMGPFPAETVEALISMKPAFRVLGNHDRYVSRDPGLAALERYFRCREGADHNAWTAAALDESSKAWLGEAPLQLSFSFGGAEFSSFHASKESDEVPFKLSEEPANVLCGHVHSPFVVAMGSGRLAVNPGSVGSPLDGNPAASYALLSVNGKVSAEIIRVAYDIDAFSAALEARAVPWAGVIGRVVRKASLF